MSNEEKKQLKQNSGDDKVRTKYTALELLDMGITETPYLIQDLVPKVGIFAIAGTSDCGKSSLLRQMAISIAIGTEDFIGFKINEPRSGVLYVSTEDEIQSTAAALSIGYAKYFKHRDINLHNLIFEFDEGDEPIKYIDDALKLAKGEIKLVIIDAYSDVIKRDSNRLDAVRSFLNEFKRLAVRHQCAIGFLHHVGKGKESNSPDKTNVLGSQGFEAKMRLLIELRPDKEHNTKRYLSILKGNHLTDEQKRYSYVLEFEELVFSNTGEIVEKSSLGSSKTNEEPEWLNEAQKLHSNGMTYIEISQTLEKNGYKNCSKSTVGRYLKTNK